MPLASASPATVGTPPIALDTHCRDKARDFITSLYGADQRIDFCRRDEFRMRFRVSALAALRLVKVQVSALDCERSTEGVVQIVLPTAGELVQSWPGADDEIIAGPHLATVVRPFRKTRQRSRAGCAVVLTLPVATLRQELESSFEQSCSECDLADLPASIDLRTPVGAALSRCVNSSLHEVQALQFAGMGHLADRAFEGQLLTLAIAALFPGLADPDGGAGAAAELGAVEEVRSYLRAHASEPVSLAALAASFGCRPRALQRAFRQRYGVSPRDYLVACRLELARQSLLGTQCTVTQAAFGSGFSDLSHFAQSYRKFYGEQPSATKRRVGRGTGKV